MGNKAGKLAKEKLHHPSFFYEGVKAAHEGRYCTSEIYFENALESHPGREFWVKLHKGMNVVDTIVKHVNENDSEVNKTICTEDTTLELFLDERANHVLDYIRLSMDIMHTYLSLSPNRVNGGIALGYCMSICRGTRDLNHLLTIWAREAGKSFMSPEMVANTVNPFKKVMNENKGEECVALCTVVTTICLFQSTIQHYWICACINYCILSLQFAEHLEGRSQLKHRGRVYANVIDLASAAMYNLQELSNRLEYTNAAKDLKARMPKVTFTPFLSENLTSENGLHYQATETNTRCSKQSTRDVKPSIFTTSTVTQPFFYQGRRVNVDSKLSPYVREDPPIRLVVKTQVSRESLARIRSAGKRDTYFYLAWFFKRSVSIVPGHSLHFLRKDLPYYVVKLESLCKKSTRGLGSVETDMTSIIIDRDLNSPSDFFQGVRLKLNSDEDEGVKDKATENETGGNENHLIAMEVCETVNTDDRGAQDEVKTNLQNYENVYLNFKDDTTLRLLTIEEAFLTQSIFAFIKAKILKRKKYFEDAERLNEFVRSTSANFYGTSSHEVEFLFNIESYINI
ncbi:unnamed protein product [Phytomonas sp. EM1]|nr:unnamed protein product [Phytomonas sp. EM1]|eukprot:CCW65402.1 unnamed protein product [Phytomonas sp. isolate EM1]